MNIARVMVAVLLLMPAAAVPADMQDEILHLLDYVENSGCEFERNGSAHEARQARAHMERKYNHVKSRVDQAEDFIRYAGTRSSMSGRKYHVTCGGKTLTSAAWLQDELSRYRNSNPGSATLN